MGAKLSEKILGKRNFCIIMAGLEYSGKETLLDRIKLKLENN